jgi:predicted SnoaL-like aldol condensation-catalyzing enzyme
MATAREKSRTAKKAKASGRAVSHLVKRKIVKKKAAGLKVTAAARQAANKRLVLTFYSHIIGRKDFEAGRKYMGATYRQHSPYATDGHEGLAAFVKFFKENFPNHRYEVKKVIAEGDMVVLHLHGMGGMNPFGEQVVDFFRVKDGKVVEHWDVIQPIPEKSENPNGVF